MLKIGCNSIVEDTINKLRSNGIVDIALVTGYKSEVYKKKLQNVTFLKIPIGRLLIAHIHCYVL